LLLLLLLSPPLHTQHTTPHHTTSSMDEDGLLDGGLTEDDLIDDAEVDSLLRESIAVAVGDAQFLHAKIDAMSANIVEGGLKRLAALNKPFKFVLTCNLSQKAGAGLHAATCTRWGAKTDGKLSVQWENQTMMVLLTVYWLAI
jgi:dynein light chain Tctex-type 1